MKFKNLKSDDILVSPFEVHKTFTVTNLDSGSGVFALPITKGTDATQYNWTTDSAFKTISSSIFHSLPNYYVINKMFYRDIANMSGYIDYIHGIPNGVNPIISYTETRNLYDTVNNPDLQTLRRPYTRQLHTSASVISIPQKLYGEYISPMSVRLTDDSTDSTLILQDDGYGNLYDIAFSSSYSARIPDSNNSGSVVGNVFYNDGLVVITDTGSYSSVGLGGGSDGFSLTFNSTQTIYESEYVCNIGENEFLQTTNKSLKVGYSGSVEFTGNDLDDGIYRNSELDDYPYDLTGYSTSSYKNNEPYKVGTELIGAATHSDFSTYVTSIGLYNNKNELLVIAKTAKPIKNEKEMALNFVIRFDTT